MGIIQASIPLFFVLIAVELLYARLGRRAFYRLNDSISDLSAGTISQIAGIFTKVLLVGAYGWVFTHARIQYLFAVPDWPDGAMLLRDSSGWHVDVASIVGWTTTFLVVDFAYYWFHRYSHEVNVLWAGHIVHHSSEEYNLAVALRQTAVGGLLSWVFYVPLAVAGITLMQFAVCYAINLVYQFWIHTRAIGRLPRWAESVLNTPSHHRVHHGVNPEYQDRNYAGVFIVWDRMFGTYTPEVQEPVYGLTTPLRSWNPLWAQLHHYVAIARNVRHATTWSDRWQYVFGSPAWRPVSAGGVIVVPPVSANTFLKFDPTVSEALAYYALMHFALSIPPALWLLTQADALSPASLVAGTFYVVVALTNVGGILEGRRWAYATERARLVALGAAAVVWLWQGRAGPWVAIVALVVVVVSLLVVWRYRADFVVNSNEGMDQHGGF